MTRVLARRVLFEGQEYPMSYVELDESGTSVRIYPFERELPGASWVDATVSVEKVGDKYVLVSVKK